MNGVFTFSIDKPLIIKKEGPRGPFPVTRILAAKKLIASQAWRELAFHTHCQYIMTKEKRSLRSPLFANLR
jgi:hypothetical protein